MEGNAKFVTQESEWDRFDSAGMMLPLNIDVKYDSGRSDEAALQGRRGMAGGTSWNVKPNFDDSFKDFHSLATSPEPSEFYGRRTPGAAAGAPYAAACHLAAAAHPLAGAAHPLAGAAHPLAGAAAHPLAATAHPLATAAHPLATAAHPLAAAARSLTSTTHFLPAAARSQAPITRPEMAATGSEPISVGERARAAWTAIANRHRGLEPSDGNHGDSLCHREVPAKTAQQIMWELLQDPTFDSSFLRHLLLENVNSKLGPPAAEAPSAGDNPTCKFCRNNNEEDIYHLFKDANGLVVCPVLYKHVCDLCGVSGPLAHTRKYCSMNPLTLGCPEEGGFPPGMLPKDVYETTQMLLRMNCRNNSI